MDEQIKIRMMTKEETAVVDTLYAEFKAEVARLQDELMMTEALLEDVRADLAHAREEASTLRVQAFQACAERDIARAERDAALIEIGQWKNISQKWDARAHRMEEERDEWKALAVTAREFLLPGINRVIDVGIWHSRLDALKAKYPS